VGFWTETVEHVMETNGVLTASGALAGSLRSRRSRVSFAHVWRDVARGRFRGAYFVWYRAMRRSDPRWVERERRRHREFYAKRMESEENRRRECERHRAWRARMVADPAWREKERLRHRKRNRDPEVRARNIERLRLRRQRLKAQRGVGQNEIRAIRER